MMNQSDRALLTAVMASLSISISRAEEKHTAQGQADARSAIWARLSPAIDIASNLAAHATGDAQRVEFDITLTAKTEAVMSETITFDDTGNSERHYPQCVNRIFSGNPRE